MGHQMRSHWIRFGLFGPVPLARMWLRLRKRAEIAAVRPHLDTGFYARQLHRPGMRVAMARDPALHYLVVGAGRLLSPHPHFDAVRHWREHPGLLRRQVFLDACAGGWRPGADAPTISASARGVALLLDHARGGGASHYLDLYAERLKAEGYDPVRAVRLASVDPLFVVATGAGRRVFSIGQDMADVIAQLGVTRLVVNHLVDVPPDRFRAIPDIAGRLGIDYEVLVHDYFFACPRIDLIARDGRCCDLAPVERCSPCLGPGGPDPVGWREGAQALLKGAARITAPSADITRRMQRAFPGVGMDIVEPERDSDLAGASAPRGTGPVRIAVVGALSGAKGFDVLVALASYARAAGAEVGFVLIGHSMDDPLLRRAGVCITGRYAPAQLPDIVRRERPDLILFPGIWPETWSFALSEALRTGVEIVAFDIGAIALRLRRMDRGHILPLSLAEQPDALLRALVSTARAARTAVS